MIKEQIKKNGFVFLGKFHSEKDDDEISSIFGVRSCSRNESAIHTLTPQKIDVTTPNTYSGIYGYDNFPFHTDLAHWKLPPRYLLLRCVVGFQDVPTLIVDGKKVIEIAGKLLLSRALVQPRRPIKGRLPLHRLLEDIEGEMLLRWDSVFLKPASKAGIKGMSSLGNAIDKCDNSSFALKDNGDTILIDNWRMLHARSSVGNQHANRQITRIYFEELF